jgi:hypothetical protein
MADSVTEHFDDPNLKSAVRRCWACDCAPAELRERVRGILNSEIEQSSSVSIFRFPRSTWMLAAAAVVALMIGLSAHYWPASSTPIQTVALAQLPPTLPADLTHRHDECCQSKHHQLPEVPKTDDTAITIALQTQLSRPVLVAHPSEPGWDFHGAAICPVGTIPAGHLVFSRGTDTLSIFSLPKSAAPGLTEGEEFATTTGSHCIAGFEKNGAVFCLVSNSPNGTLTPSDVRKMRTQMEANVTVARNDTPEPVVVAELLRPR